MDIGRRAFLTGLSGSAVLVLAACTDAGPAPSPSPTPTATPSPTPSPFATSAAGLPTPAAALRSEWGSDPFARGASTFLPAGVEEDVRAVLRQPVDDRLFLAGEGVAASQPGTLPGARSSGFAVAEQVAAVAEPGERIAVLGAGLAGATAARSLADRGLDVVVVEARGRVGGRVHSPDDRGWQVRPELGGGALWGRQSLALRVALDLAGVTTVPFTTVTEARVTTAPAGTDDSGTDDGAATASPTDGTATDATTAGGATTDLLTDPVRQALASVAAWPTSAAGAGASVADARSASGADAALGPTADATGTTDEERLDWLLGDALAARTGADADRLPAARADEALVPEELRLVTGGLQGFVADQLDGLDVLTGATVVHLQHGDRGVGLRLATGESLSVDRVVVTVPVAVLRDGDLEIEPALPDEHLAALDALGVGQQETLWLRFDEPFWTSTATVWAVLDEDAAYRVWLDLLPVTGQPVLVALTGGSAAERLAGLDDDAAVEAALASLRPYLDLPDGSPAPTEPAAPDDSPAPDDGSAATTD